MLNGINLIIITGFPATGKTTLGSELSKRLRIPLISKDAIKERIFDSLGSKDKKWSDKVSIAAHRITDYIIDEEFKSKHSIILESNYSFQPDSERFSEFAARYKLNVIQILCYAEGDTLFNRFMLRQETKRHKGHVESSTPEQIREYFDNGKRKKLALPGHCIEVDMNDFSKVDYDSIAEEVRSFLK